MVKYYHREDSLKFPWDQVAQAFWRRYPNPFSSHVLTEDVVFRKVEGSKLYTKRLLTKTNRLPKWGEKIVNIKNVRVIEESVIDRDAKTITTYTRNIGFRSIMTLEERCVYKIGVQENVKNTMIERQAWVSSSWRGFSTAIQAFGVERFKKNVNKTTKGLIYVLDKLFPSPIIETTSINTEKLRETAKKATELAKSKAVPLMAAAACSANQKL